MENLIKYSINKNYNELNKTINNIQISSYSITNMIEPFTYLIIKSNKFNDKEKSLIIQKIVSVDQNLLKGCDEFIQLYRLVYYIMMIKN